MFNLLKTIFSFTKFHISTLRIRSNSCFSGLMSWSNAFNIFRGILFELNFKKLFKISLLINYLCRIRSLYLHFTGVIFYVMIVEINHWISQLLFLSIHFILPLNISIIDITTIDSNITIVSIIWTECALQYNLILTSLIAFSFWISIYSDILSFFFLIHVFYLSKKLLVLIILDF